MFLVDADFTKSMLATERATRFVEKKNARQQFPQTEPFRFVDDTSEQLIADASASPIAMDVHRKFADAPITFPVPVRASASPADDFASDFRNNSGVMTSD